MKKKKEKPNQDILDSFDSPNVWTPDKEDKWLQELNKLSNGEIYRRFPPMPKLPYIRRKGKNYVN